MKAIIRFFYKNFLLGKKRWHNLSPKERIYIASSFLFILIGLIFLLNALLNKITVIKPDYNGSLKLGIVGRPSHINPILTKSNDCDRELIELIYDGLYSIDGKGQLIPELADKVEISEDKKTYILFLKENVLWHDGVPFTADDVIFTIETIQDPKFQSPLRLNWEGVVVEKLSNYALRFNLKTSYEPFLQNLTLKIIPKHIWENIEPYSFSLADYNLKPIGTGPYLFESLEKNKSGKIINYYLSANKNYFIKTPYLSKIIFRFYDNYNSAKEGLLKNEVEGFSPLIIEDVNFFGAKKGIKISSLSLPRYYAVFFNLKKPLFQKKEIRQALDLALSREELTKEILSNQALPLAGPISPGFFGYNSDLKNDYSPAEAKKIIDQFLSSASKKENSENSEGKIKFTLSLPENLELIKVANYLKDAWGKIGINVELEILPLNELEKQVIQTRSYDALLFGEIIGQDSNLLSFWHSSQANDSGLNLSSFQNKELDKLLEETWQIDDKEKQEQNIKRIQEILKENKPAIFLYNPYYLYVLPKKIKGNGIKYANLPSERLADIENWYIFTKRTLK